MRWIAIVAAFLPSAAAAAPTYLQCTFMKESRTTVLEVTADEASGTVTTLVQSSGFSERRTAVFSPTSVKWSSPMSFGGLRYDLSRTDLSIKRDLVIGDKTFPEQGICRIQTAPKRAF